MLLSVIVPAYNEEEKNLNANLKKFDAYLKKQNYDYEIIIINDGSTDDTKNIAEKMLAEIKNLKLINNPTNMGKGAALREGFLKAGGEYQVFIDADGATSIEHIDKLWLEFKKGYDIVIGSRNKKDASGAKIIIAQPLWKRLLGKSGNFLIREFFAIKIRDTQCGFKAFTKQAAENILPKTTINRFLIDVEILALARKLNYKISAIPVNWIDDGKSRVKIKGYATSLKEIIKIKLNLLRGKYKIN